MAAALASTDRRVRRVSLESPRASVGRAAFLIEDALRTASFGETGVVVIRALDLGVIDPREPPMVLSRRIEQRWRALAASAVDARIPAAAVAEGVWFSSEASMLALYIHRKHRGREVRAWYWNKALPVAVGEASEVAAAVVAVVAHLLRGRAFYEGHAAVCEFFAELRELGSDREIVNALPEDHARSVLRWWVPKIVNRWESRTRDVEDEWRDSVQSKGMPLARVLGLAVDLVVRGERLADLPRAMAEAIFVAPQVPGSTREREDATSCDVSTPVSAAESLLAHLHGLIPVMKVGDASVAGLDLRDGLREGLVEAARQRVRADVEAVLEIAVGQRRGLIPTLHGGLFFALGVLRHVGFSDVLENHELLRDVLTRIARSAGAEGDDPLLAAIEREPGDPAAAEWHGKARRWTRRNPRMLLSWMVRRPAQVSVTRSHIDVCFGLHQADIRLRRFGLDLNPGWVPALGRVVMFHYDGNRT